MKKGLVAYWRRVATRSFLETKVMLGSNPLKATISLIVVIAAAAISAVVLGHDAWDKVGWAVLVLILGLAVFGACWAVKFINTPCKIEAERDQEAQSKIDEVKALFLQVNSQIDELRQSSQVASAPDGSRKNKILSIRRWIQSGEKLISRLSATVPLGDSFAELADWADGADRFVQSDFPGFLGRFMSDDGMPPGTVQSAFAGAPYRELRKEVCRRVERFRELENMQ